ncbi:restriction endonuclease subunit S [Bacillus halotolerans]|uniref:restriction endonuclease subunit S n=1 Tax=Bacillus TaxID=1386 RepID=UPI0024C0ECAA|nr:restriction endonuclease subunit S [Bacillus halotolerans]WHY25177.1 restriction endonuclease subunit S [Bacillus halotolerans]
MPTYKLKDLVTEVISGEWGQEPSDEFSGVKVIRTTNFSNTGKLDLHKEVVTREIEPEKVDKKKLLVGDIIIEKSGGSPEQPVGRVVFFEENDIYLCNNFTSVLRPNKDLVEPKYLMYLMFNLHRTRRVLKFQNKTTGIINLKLDQYLQQTEVVIPLKEIQQKIVKVLDKTFDLINKRQSQIATLDELINSYFYETLKTDLKSLSLENLIVSTQNGMSRRGNDENGQVVLKLKNIKNNEVNFDNINRIDLTERELETYEVNEQDLLVVRVNGNPKFVGRSAVFKGYEEPIYFNDHIIRVVVANVNVEYLSYLLNSNLGISEILKNIKTSAGQYTISRDGLNKIKLRLPDENVQNEFKRKRDIIDLKKARLMESLENLKMLYDSILQKAFKGELFQKYV